MFSGFVTMVENVEKTQRVNAFLDTLAKIVVFLRIIFHKSSFNDQIFHAILLYNAGSRACPFDSYHEERWSCNNNGKAENCESYDNYSCSCPFGYTGKHCGRITRDYQRFDNDNFFQPLEYVTRHVIYRSNE